MASTAPSLDLDSWGRSPLGEPGSWPDALRTAAELCLAYPTPCCVLWGEQSQFLYNDAMARDIGIKHPSGMGQPLYDVMPFLWRTIGPVVHEVMRTGRGITANRFPIEADLGDGVSQYFVDFTFVPIRDDDRVVGVFAPVVDSTVGHLDGQHQAAVAQVASVPTGLSREQVAVQVARHLVAPDDVRYAVLFLCDHASGELTRVATAGAPLRASSTRAALDVAVEQGVWPLAAVLAERRGPERIGVPLRGSRASRPLWQDAWLVALPAPVDGVLVVGLDARYVTEAGPESVICRLAAAAGERLGR